MTRRLPGYLSGPLVSGLLSMCLLGCSSTPETDTSVGNAESAGGDTAVLTPEAFIAGQQLVDDGPGDEDEVTCRIERPLGSHIRKKVCTSEAERQREAIEARHLMKTRQEVTRK